MFKMKSILFGLLVVLAMFLSSPSLFGQIPKYAYAGNAGSNDVSAYTIDATTGALSPIGNFDLASNPWAMAIGVDHKFQCLYAASHTGLIPPNLSEFRIEANGALTFVTADYPGLNAVAVAAHPTKDYF